MTLTEIGQGSQILGGMFISVGLGPLATAAHPFFCPSPPWGDAVHSETSLYFSLELGDQRLFIITMR